MPVQTKQLHVRVFCSEFRIKEGFVFGLPWSKPVFIMILVEEQRKIFQKPKIRGENIGWKVCLEINAKIGVAPIFLPKLNPKGGMLVI